MPFDYPVYLDLGDADVLVVGGGRVALRKVEGVLAAGAHVTVVAPVIDAAVVALGVATFLRPYAPGDIAGRMLVITTSDDPAVNAAVAADARAARVLVNSADDPVNCTFILPAVARRGRMTVAVSSGGGSPALAQYVRDRVAGDVLTAQVEAAADTLAAERDAIHAAGGSTEGLDWGRRLNELLGASGRDESTSGSDGSTP
ncbi:MAG: bifunctional precorrin-2 dehydrogenase/sirohydrochlorin ferrochelatase [Ilumatobacteraceae bacterium]